MIFILAHNNQEQCLKVLPQSNYLVEHGIFCYVLNGHAVYCSRLIILVHGILEASGGRGYITADA